MEKGKIILEKVKDFNVDHIFDCGQCFRWNREEDGSYTGIAGGKVVNISVHGDNVTIENTNVEEFENFWRHYLDLDTDYSQIKKELSKDPVMKEAVKTGEGIRILNQEVWETIVSFIISANNNIPRIKGCIESLCENFGENIGRFRGKTRYAFPTPEVLASLEQDDLIPCRLGYRARYIIETARKFTENGSEFYENMKKKEISYERASKNIRALSGVGPKVADCILLFSLEKRNAFPIDVWMKRVMNALYSIDEDDVKAMSDFATENFGENAGIAQQYLFYYMRNRKQ